MTKKQKAICEEYEEYFIRNIRQRFDELQLENRPMPRDLLMGILYYCRPKKD